jgi:hypothetical protein
MSHVYEINDKLQYNTQLWEMVSLIYLYEDTYFYWIIDNYW